MLSRRLLLLLSIFQRNARFENIRRLETEGDAALIVRARKCSLRILSAVCLVVLTLWTGSALAASSPGAPDRENVLSPSQPPSLLQPPKAAVPTTRIAPDKPAGPLPAGGPRILVCGFRIAGDSPVPPATLQALLQGEAGKELTLRELGDLAARLTAHLRQQGFLVAFAHLLPQQVEDGIVAFGIIPGRYDRIAIRGNAHVNDAFLRSLFHAVREGEIIRRDPLERALLLAGDFPGLTVRTTLSPGRRQGTADLIIEAVDAKPVTGATYIDNWGSRYTGNVRYGAQVSYNNLSGFGDVLSLLGLTSFNGLNNYDISYGVPLGRDGLRATLRQSQVNYSLGDAFADMNATGKANTTSVALHYPLIRRRAFTLNANLGFDHKRLRDDIETADSHIPRRDNLWNIGLSGSFDDHWGGGGSNAFSLLYSRGNIGFDDEAAAAEDEATARTAGGFGKLLFTYQRQQVLRKNLQLLLNFAGQLADKNLDTAEKFYLGGPGGVRAYPQGEATGDQGYRLSGELRLLVPGLSSAKSSFFVNGFFDCGAVRLNKNPWVGSGDANYRSLSGAGLGVLWTRGDDYSLRLDYAWKTSAEAAVSDHDKAGRLWLQVVKYF